MEISCWIRINRCFGFIFCLSSIIFDVSCTVARRPLVLQFITNATKRNAVCNDGTNAGYYYRNALVTDFSDYWVIWLEGGGYCYDYDSCISRCKFDPNLCSSNDWNSSLILDGIMSDLPIDNIDFYQFNHIFIPYCSSDLWSGHTIDNINNNNSLNMTFNGFDIVKAVIEDLIDNRTTVTKYNLQNAKHVLLGGDNAGGIGTLGMFF